LDPLPSVAVSVGDEVTVSGLAKIGSLSASPASLVEFHGVSLVAVRAGRTVITAHRGVSCLPVPGHGQPSSCGLLQIIAG